jgi:hypothetical protein
MKPFTIVVFRGYQPPNGGLPGSGRAGQDNEDSFIHTSHPSDFIVGIVPK